MIDFAIVNKKYNYYESNQPYYTRSLAPRHTHDLDLSQC